MRKILFVLTLMFVTAVAAATSVGQVGATTGTGGAFIGLGKPAVTPNATPGKSVPQGVIIKKIIASPVTPGVTSDFELWDAPSGLTYSAEARKLVAVNIGISLTANVLELNFTTPASQNKLEDGLYFKYFPIWVNNDANTVNATIMWEPFTRPTTRP